MTCCLVEATYQETPEFYCLFIFTVENSRIEALKSESDASFLEGFPGFIDILG